MSLSDILLIDADDIARLSPYPQLIDAIADAFQNSPVTPKRNHYQIEAKTGSTLLSMPAWNASEYIGQKLVTVMPENTKQGLETIQGMYALMSAKTGVPLAIMDASELTARRTAAASALAAKYLARSDAETLLVVGSGKLAPYLIEAHMAVRSYKEIIVWGRNLEKAHNLCKKIGLNNIAIRVSEDIENACRQADVISCATTSTEPLVFGEWLKEGAHLDLVGAFKPTMRECDNNAIVKSSIFVDTYLGVLAEGGDIVQAIGANAIEEADICTDLKTLACGGHSGRRSVKENTLFKSVGTAIEDYAIACLVYENLT